MHHMNQNNLGVQSVGVWVETAKIQPTPASETPPSGPGDAHQVVAACEWIDKSKMAT